MSTSTPKTTIKKNPRINSEMEADVWFEPELVIEAFFSAENANIYLIVINSI